jgi:hypothetical protein
MTELMRRLHFHQKLYWRTLDCKRVRGVDQIIFQYRVERKSFPSTQTITEKVTFYFMPESIDLSSEMPTMFNPKVFNHESIVLPRELDWLRENGNKVEVGCQ